MHVRSSDHSLFRHGPDNKLDSHTITKFALPQKIFGPIVQRIKKVELPALSPQKFGLHGTFAYPSPSVEPTLLHAGTPFWVGHPTFDGKMGAGDRKRNLPNIHGVL